MTEKGTLKNEKMKGEHFDVTRTRKRAECGSGEETGGSHCTPLYIHTWYAISNTNKNQIFVDFCIILRDG